MTDADSTTCSDPCKPPAQGGYFHREKLKRNLDKGYQPTKGLQNGHCNRAACQAPLAGQEQWSMMDHETFTDARLFYCAKCARLFNETDARSGDRQRCRLECEALTSTMAALGAVHTGQLRDANRNPS